MRIWSLVLLACSSAALAADFPKEKTDLVGYAYELDSGRYLYSEHHAFVYQGDRLVADTVTYRDAQGKVFGSKTLDYRPDLFVPNFHTRLNHIGYEEGLRRRDGQAELFKRDRAGAELETKILKDTERSAADAGFHPYVQAHFDELMSGETIRFQFISADFLTGVKFKAKRIEDGSFEGRPVARFKVKIASLIGLFIDPLIVSYDPKTRWLVEYQGISNVKDEKGDSYDTRIIYPSKPPKDAPAPS